MWRCFSSRAWTSLSDRHRLAGAPRAVRDRERRRGSDFATLAISTPTAALPARD